MRDKHIKEIENDIKSGVSYFYFSEDKDLASFKGSCSEFKLLIVPSIYKIISSGNISIDKFAKLLSVYEEMKNEDE